MLEIEVPSAKMICDTRAGDGGVYFYNDRLEWRARSSFTGHNFIIHYKDIEDVQVIPSRKKEIKISTNVGTKYSLFLYRSDEFINILSAHMKKAPQEEAKAIEVKDNNEDGFAKLEKLVQMRKDNLLNEEEFEAAKKKLLGL